MADATIISNSGYFRARFIPLSVKTAEDLFDLIRKRKTEQEWDTVTVKPKLRRHANRQAVRRSPINGWAKILRSLGGAKAVGRSQATIHLRPNLKLLAAEYTLVRTGGQLQRPADAYCIAEF